MAHDVATVYAYADSVVGLWRENCLKTTAYMIEVSALLADGVTNMGIWQGCHECGDWAQYISPAT